MITISLKNSNKTIQFIALKKSAHKSTGIQFFSLKQQQKFLTYIKLHCFTTDNSLSHKITQKKAKKMFFI